MDQIGAKRMWWNSEEDEAPSRGFLSRLARDKRGNALALMAMAMIPLIGVLGGAVDLSRLYLVKTRLQHACDAGALAGRKQMGGGAWTTGAASSSNEVAKQFFTGNFHFNAYGATGVTKAFSEQNGAVNGTASATVPMTLMSVFSMPAKTLTVTCRAQEQVPNTDVMFVLDTTESMSEAPDGSGHLSAGATPTTQSKIVNLKSAVKCFFEALSKLDTNDGSCDPITGVATTSRLRFGIVPYATNVNIKQLGLPDAYFAKEWSYQSRDWRKGDKLWRYKQVKFDLTGFNNSTAKFSFSLGSEGAGVDVPWDGCVEEDVPLSNINAVPTTSNAKSLYAPYLPAAVYYRKHGKGSSPTLANLQEADFDSANEVFSASTYPYGHCPAASYALQTYAGATNFVSRVNAMAHGGNTRHDIGMLWGARLLSPRGIEASDNTTTPNGGQLYRHLIFMTDGDAKANECDYATYGVPWFDKREVSAGTAVSGTNCNNLGLPNDTLTNGVNARLETLCTAVKNESNTILWVISFGGTNINAQTKARLRTCATDDNHFFDATNTPELKSAFKRIAAQISQLRLTQ